jgi:hypothetical protein
VLCDTIRAVTVALFLIGEAVPSTNRVPVTIEVETA